MVEVSKIATMQWITAVPDTFHLSNVLCTLEEFYNKKRTVEFSHVGREQKMTGKDVIAYMIIPHINSDRSIWKSPYLGDELPTENGWYICSLECKEKIIEELYIRKIWFDSKKQKFIYTGFEDILGYMDIPKQYTGKRTLNFSY